MLTFVTLFDHRYLLKGLALYRSLERHAGNDFRLWIVAASVEAESALRRLPLPKAVIVPLTEMEDDELRAVKPGRSYVEYLWTLTPSLALYVLRQDPSCQQVMYIDADCYFWGSPGPLMAEWDAASVLIHEHRYSPGYAHQQASSGRFNVGLVGARRDADGLAMLTWWRARCLEWCYNRAEAGKFGDQMYLNEFPSRFHGVHILQHPGVALAPWNIKNYALRGTAGHVQVAGQAVVMVHYHSYRFYSPTASDPAPAYFPSRTEMELIYRPYQHALAAAASEVQATGALPPDCFDTCPSWWRRWRRWLSLWRHRLARATDQY